MADSPGWHEAEVWLVRHGETEWSRDHKHTSTTDLPLTDVGEEVARALPAKLAGVDFALVLTSPRQRARRTAELAGFPDAEVDEDLVEWAYGDYEGITTVEIRETVPGWTVWSHPTPGGETAEEIAARLDRVIARARAVDGRVLLFGHGHALRVSPPAGSSSRPRRAGSSGSTPPRCRCSAIERDTPCLLRWNS